MNTVDTVVFFLLSAVTGAWFAWGVFLLTFPGSRR